MEFKERLRKIMNDQKISQKELAIRTNITEASMSKYLSGQRTPRIDVIVGIANALGVSIDYLLDNVADNQISTYFEAQAVLARGRDKMTEEEKKKLIAFLLEDL